MEFREFAYIFFHGTEFRAFFSSAEGLVTELRQFCVLRNGSERNFVSLLLFLFHGTEFRAFFSSAKRFRTEFREWVSTSTLIPDNGKGGGGWGWSQYDRKKVTGTNLGCLG